MRKEPFIARILIICGHGKVALRLEPLLVARGDTVTAVIRTPAHEPDVAIAEAVAGSSPAR